MASRSFDLMDVDGNGVSDAVDEVLDHFRTALRLSLGADDIAPVDDERLVPVLSRAITFSPPDSPSLTLNAASAALPVLEELHGTREANRVTFTFITLRAVARRLKRIDPDDGDPMTLDRSVIYEHVEAFRPGRFTLELLSRFETRNAALIERDVLGPPYWVHLFTEIDAEIDETFDDLDIPERASSAGPLPYGDPA